MDWLTGYVRTIRQYLATPKGCHDAKDYGRALLYMLLTMVGGLALLAGLEGGALTP
ncbi:hypothetical protein SAMN02910356_01890 [Selenomonas sp. GACV-9]|uniref:hypothetical protein n=1 Tax=Selenomonas sp. GACV-9 TaxID=3158782 RepID=UPI0008E30D47|nr:hypothetical protein SAMN02910356_01890 [Selenomonas ruminantium]